MAQTKQQPAKEVWADAPDVASEQDSQVEVFNPEVAQQMREQAEQDTAEGAQEMQTFISWLTEKVSGGDEETFEIMAQIMKEMLAAESPAELMAEATTLHLENVVGQPFLLHGFAIREGDYEESDLNKYAAMTVSRPGVARTRIVTAGALKVLMKLYVYEMKFNEFPLAVMFTVKKGKKGPIYDMVTY